MRLLAALLTFLGLAALIFLVAWLHAKTVADHDAALLEGYVAKTQLAAVTAERDALLGRVTRAELANSALRSDLDAADQEAALAAERIASYERDSESPDGCRVSVALLDSLRSP